MGQDSLNLMYGSRHNPKTRKGTSVDMHVDEGYGGPHMVPGYAGPYKNSKAKVLKVSGNPRLKRAEKAKVSQKKAEENGISSTRAPKRRK